MERTSPAGLISFEVYLVVNSFIAHQAQYLVE